MQAPYQFATPRALERHTSTDAAVSNDCRACDCPGTPSAVRSQSAVCGPTRPYTSQTSGVKVWGGGSDARWLKGRSSYSRARAAACTRRESSRCVRSGPSPPPNIAAQVGGAGDAGPCWLGAGRVGVAPASQGGGGGGGARGAGGGGGRPGWRGGGGGGVAVVAASRSAGATAGRAARAARRGGIHNSPVAGARRRHAAASHNPSRSARRAAVAAEGGREAGLGTGGPLSGSAEAGGEADTGARESGTSSCPYQTTGVARPAGRLDAAGKGLPDAVGTAPGGIRGGWGPTGGAAGAAAA